MVEHEMATRASNRFGSAAMEKCNFINMSELQCQVEHGLIHRDNTQDMAMVLEQHGVNPSLRQCHRQDRGCICCWAETKSFSIFP
jgi:hypothetical protein